MRVLHRSGGTARTGRNPVGLKWIDTNKGSAKAPRFRSRLVCTEVRHKGLEPIFSATPPLETLRILLGVACQEDVFQVEDTFLIFIADVSRAHFYADAVRDVSVRLPDEDTQGKAARRAWKIAKDNVRIFGCCPASGRTFCPGFAGWRVLASRGFRFAKPTFWCTVTIFSQWADVRSESMH